MKASRRSSLPWYSCDRALITSSNVVLNFMVMAIADRIGRQGWNLLGGYGGQYSFGHAAFFGTGAYVTASCRCATASTPGLALSSASPRARSLAQ